MFCKEEPRTAKCPTYRLYSVEWGRHNKQTVGFMATKKQLLLFHMRLVLIKFRDCFGKSNFTKCQNASEPDVCMQQIVKYSVLPSLYMAVCSWWDTHLKPTISPVINFSFSRPNVQYFLCSPSCFSSSHSPSSYFLYNTTDDKRNPRMAACVIFLPCQQSFWSVN